VRTVERIRTSVAMRFPWASQSPITLSAGVAELEPGSASPAALVSAADQALYAAKRAGRNRVALHGPTQPAQRAG
jgi:diguanylate cyclase (GGDEF)-like protein